MERKRKLPARAAARVEHVAKKRNSTPPDVSSTSTPPSALTSPQPAEYGAQEPPSSSSASAPLPKSLQPGQPLPTVEKPQPDDLPPKDFQSIQESGVMAESLSRSRQKWIHDGVFEKYWTKPSKRKGVVKEDNPAKDTMTKIGQIAITVEPHLLEATMYAVKDPKPAPANTNFRPIMQYGPPNGAMPPPKSTTTPPVGPQATSTTAASPTPAAAVPPPVSTAQGTQPSQPGQPSVPPTPPPKEGGRLPAQQLPPTSATPSAALSAAPASMSTPPQQPELQRPKPPTTADLSVNSGRDLKSVLAAPQQAHAPVPGPAHPRPPQPPLSQPPTPSTHPLHAPTTSTPQLTAGDTLPPLSRPMTMDDPLPPSTGSAVKATPTPAKPAANAASGADPIIVTLAERASEDPHLRDLMKRVAVGDAASHELAHFQKIIDQITQDYRKKSSAQAAQSSEFMIEGKHVKHYANEVRTILDIIKTSNPTQRSWDLRPPPGCDPLVVLLLKESLDRELIRELVQRVATGKTRFTDHAELKRNLDVLVGVLQRVDYKNTTPGTASSNPQGSNQTSLTQVKGEDASKKPSTPSATPSQSAPTPQQALRSKGPPPTKPDITAVVLEFAGGTGDRYLFPKYSILEFSADGTEVIASFLIVRKGSKLEYGGDPALDYYQPVTLRLHANAPKVLETLARVVAPQDEVQRYMDDVMEHMTRAEYVLLAMRLPRAGKEDQTDERSDTPRASETSHPSHLPGVLWDSRPTPGRPASAKPASTKSVSEDEQYQSFISTISRD
ncbi:hypothetical protein F4802DRAFT_2328 [Xylaria palmicola]|nr:hypothetical protein F4802DRAFT_2328 [Xylaria palmicola]